MTAVVMLMTPVPPTGQGLDGLMTVNLARYRPSGEHVAIRRIDLESCTNDMVAYLQVRVTGSKPPYISPLAASSSLLHRPQSDVMMKSRCGLFLLLSQGELHVSRLFHHPSILPYKSVFIAENELWVISPFMAYGKNSTQPWFSYHDS